MSHFRREDALLVAGLAAALVIIFAEPINRTLDLARQAERESGLALLPGLLLLIAVYVVHELRKRNEMQAQATAALAAQREAEARAKDLERVVEFGKALAKSLDVDAIRAAVRAHLHRIACTDRVWVLVRQGTTWETLTDETTGAQDSVDQEDLAERLMGRSQASSVGLTMGFPLVAGGAAMGVLGVTGDEETLAPERQRAMEAAAALLALSLKNAQLFREVKENSLRDPLTGCTTRAHALEVVDAELRRARRSQLPVSLLMIDLDRFKEVNDRYGHLCGDAVLASVGKRMRDVLRGSDLKSRYGGEEFLVLLPETALTGARRVAETLRREIAERPIPWAGGSITVTASFGIAQAMPGEVNVQAVIARADAALYRAKEDGRNCVRVAAEPLALVVKDKLPPQGAWGA